MPDNYTFIQPYNSTLQRKKQTLLQRHTIHRLKRYQISFMK